MASRLPANIQICPTGDWLVIDMEDTSRTAGGIQLPDGAKGGELPKAIVLEVGPGDDRTLNGERMETGLCPGDRVILMPDARGIEILSGSKTVWLMSCRAVVAVLKERVNSMYEKQDVPDFYEE